MTYKEYDNIELENSGTTCEVVLIRNLVRNSNAIWINDYVGQVMDIQTSHDASSITGTATLMTHNVIQISYQPGNPNQFPFVTIGPGSVVRNGDYVYMEKVDEESNEAARKDVIEYQISTGTTTRVVVETHYVGSYNNFIGYPHITYLMDRKILFGYEHDHGRIGTAPNRYYMEDVYLIDFETQIATKEFEWDKEYESAVGSTLPEWDDTWCDAITSVEDTNGDVWACVIGMTMHWSLMQGEPHQHFSGGVFVHYKNYTQDTAWQTARCEVGARTYDNNRECWIDDNPVVIGREKIAIVSGSRNIFIFDIATQTLTVVNGPTEVWFANPLVYDATSNFLYFLDWSIAEDERYCVDSYNIETGEFTYNICTVKDPYWEGDATLVSNRNHAYVIFGIDDSVYLLNGNVATLTGWITTTCWLGNGNSLVPDDNGPALVWWDEDDNATLYRRRFDNTILNTYDSLGITPPSSSGYVYVIHADDAYIIVAAGFRKPVDYWIVR